MNGFTCDTAHPQIVGPVFFQILHDISNDIERRTFWLFV